jgi:hypothetical protein
VLDHISADSLRGNLSFLASDLLEGRDTPSRGLETAAEYIAAQFRRAGLEPAGDTGYFQNASFLVVEQAKHGFALELHAKVQTFAIVRDEAKYSLRGALALSRVPVVLLDLDAVANHDVEGKVVVMPLPDFSGPQGRALYGKYQAALGTLEKLKPAAILWMDRDGRGGPGAAPTVVDASEAVTRPPTLFLHGKAAMEWYDAVKADGARAAVSVRVPAPAEKPMQLHNVIGILRGSDPVLKNTYVLVTAHYDHIGVKAAGEGDRIFNGANDDGSGTVSVIELASALATLRQRPKRSIVFMTFFGEERGGLGSRYYARHPVFPLAQTVADLNLEQLGRTDSTEGPKIKTGNFTGFDFSNLPEIFREAGEKTGVHIVDDKDHSDDYFAASDNVNLALAGVPAHTFSVTYEFPDYHGVGDEWYKIDYDNMAKVDRMLAAGILDLAGRPEAPKWNEANPKTEPYVKAWKELERR